MAYFKIDGVDFSHLVKGLNVGSNAIYNTQTNAAGNSVVDYINTKRQIDVTIIPIGDDDMRQLQAAIEAFNVTLSFRNPKTGLLEESVNCIIPSNNADYYTIQTNKVMYKEVTLSFIEL